MMYLELFFDFFKVGLFSIGGGLATLPFLYEMQKNTGWFTIGDISNMIAVSESTPGPMGVNMATYVGYTSAGAFGGAIATLGLIAPSIIIIIIVSNFMQKFKENKYVKGALYALKAASVALISVAGVGVMRVCFLNGGIFDPANPFLNQVLWKSVLYGVILFAVTKITKKSNPIMMIVVSGLVGFLFKM
ncbi:MAG: chromate transporter [Lachnospiraceae bacterium]|nr:chromate transporter [Lachnospiraceae bacterium]